MEKEANKIDFLAIGDIVIDAFIKLKDASVHCNVNHEGCELCMRFGDKVPYESVTILPAVGNSGNAAVSAARLGLETALISNIGGDQYGKDCLSVVEKEKIMTDYLNIQNDKKTNYHYVLWYEDERTILIKHTAFDYKFPDLSNKKISWVYLSSMAENSLEYHNEILEFLKNHPETKLAFQPGTYQIKFGTEKLKDIYARTDAFFCNKEEAERILNVENKEILELAKGIEALGPKMIFISDGEAGAYFYQNGELYHMPIYHNDIPSLERTGAGDAFSSTVVASMAMGKNPIEAFTWGQINSMSVIRYIGAQEGLLSKEKILEYLEKAPADYKIEKINPHT